MRPYVFTGRPKRISIRPTPIVANNARQRETYGKNWATLAEACKRRDNYTCRGKCKRYFGKRLKFLLDAHHIIPLSKGGSNTLANLKTECKKCHRNEHPHMKKAYERRKIRRRQ